MLDGNNDVDWAVSVVRLGLVIVLELVENMRKRFAESLGLRTKNVLLCFVNLMR